MSTRRSVKRDQVLRILFEKKERGATWTEIIDESNLSPRGLSGILKRLQDDMLVIHHGTRYYLIVEDPFVPWLQFSYGYPGPLEIGEVNVTSKIYSTMPELMKRMRSLISRKHFQRNVNNLLHNIFSSYNVVFSFTYPPTLDMLRRVDVLIDPYDFDFAITINFFGRQFAEEVRRGPLREKLMEEIERRKETVIDAEIEEVTNDEERIIRNIPQLLSLWSHRDRIMFSESDFLLSIREELEISLNSLDGLEGKGYFTKNEDGYYKWTGKTV